MPKEDKTLDSLLKNCKKDVCDGGLMEVSVKEFLMLIRYPGVIDYIANERYNGRNQWEHRVILIYNGNKKEFRAFSKNSIPVKNLI